MEIIDKQTVTKKIKSEKFSHLQKVLLHELKKRHSHVDEWEKLARPSQRVPEGDWHIWLILAGRGFGKTRTGSETIKLLAQKQGYRRIALIGSSIIEARNIMVDGISGIRSCFPITKAPKLHMTTRQLHFKNGAVATLFGAEQADQLRGHQFDLVWIDEFAKFRDPNTLLEQMALTLRLGQKPRCVITTTPRPLKILQDLMSRKDVVVTRGSTFENKDHLSADFLETVGRQFDGTKLGSQELYGEMLIDIDGALWQRQSIIYAEPKYDEVGHPILRRIVVAIDPATTHHAGSDETGIIVAGVDEAGHGYVLEDLSGRHSPLDWGQRAVEAYHRYKADRVIAETNKGGDLVERIVRSVDANVAYQEVRATRGKATRAEPIAALYEKKRVFHARPLLKLEEQMCSYIPGVSSKSPDRVDALVWGMTELLLNGEARMQAKIWGI